MRSVIVGGALALSAVAALPAQAQPQTASPGPPIRQLPAGTALTTEPLMSITGVRALSDGRVLLNDGARRQLLMFDSTLTRATVIADSAIGFPDAYGTRPGVLMAYRADSSLLADAGSLSMLVINPAGKVVRVRALPRSQDATRIASPYTGFDAQGRIIYRGLPVSRPPTIPKGGGIAVPESPDSVGLYRVDLETRKLDTVAKIKIPKSSMVVTQSPTGSMRVMSRYNPMNTVDEWVVTSDGAIALIRGRDYHIDWVKPDGSRTSTPRMPFDWQRMTDEYKVFFLDSIRNAMEAQGKAEMARMQARYDSLAAIAQATKGPPPPPLPVMTTEMFAPPTMVDPEELPDYRPPFTTNSMRADADGNIWIRTNPMKPTPGGLVYDIVNRDGVLFDRIQVAPPRTVVGFGPGGVVYLTVRDARGVHLQRAHVGR